MNTAAGCPRVVHSWCTHGQKVDLGDSHVAQLVTSIQGYLSRDLPLLQLVFSSICCAVLYLFAQVPPFPVRLPKLSEALAECISVHSD